MGWGAKAGLIALVLACVPVGAAARELSLTARAALIMDASTGEVIWERNGATPFPPASTTKVMTAILALESGRLDESMVCSSDAAACAPSKINLRPGQRMQLRSLVYAALLNSANDASTVIAEGLAGSEEAFAARMNTKARDIGARTAHFVNPHGLTAPGHVASARDLATIFRYGLRVPLFREVLETRSIVVPVQNYGERGTAKRISLRSHNRLLTGYTYPVIGKTGYTRAARRCFVGAATSGDREVIVALLGSNDLWGDAKKLIAYGFVGSNDGPKIQMARPTPILTVPPRKETPAVSEGDLEVTDDPPPVGRYTVQLGPYVSRTAASSTRTKLAKRGYNVALNGRHLRIGSYQSLKTANRTAGRLRARGYRPLVVALR